MSVDNLVLIVEDEPDLRDILSSLLKTEGYTVVSVENGQAAFQKLQAQKFRFVVTDIQMPLMNGIELFEKTQALRKTPFIMTTGFSDLIDIDRAYKMGISEFLQKPFQNEDLISCVKLIEHEIRGGADSLEQSSLDSNYCRVHVDDFLSGSKVQADIYLKIGDNKYLRVAKQDSPMSKERIESYKKKGLEYFFIRNSDFANYVGFNLSLANAISKKATIPRHRKLSVIQHSLEVVLQDAYANGITKEKFNNAKGLVETSLNVLFESKDLFGVLEMLKSQRDKTYAHSLGVSLYAVAIAQAWGWNSASSLFKISMAGIFHDIGKKELPQELLDKSRIEMTAEEIKLFESHTLRGQELLMRIPGIPEEVIQSAAEHHEALSGRGFPRGINRQRIHPLARIIAVANEFCELVLPVGALGMDPKDAIARIYQNKKDDLDLLALRSVMQMFEYPIPRELAKLSAPKTLSS